MVHGKPNTKKEDTFYAYKYIHRPNGKMAQRHRVKVSYMRVQQSMAKYRLLYEDLIFDLCTC